MGIVEDIVSILKLILYPKCMLDHSDAVCHVIHLLTHSQLRSSLHIKTYLHMCPKQHLKLINQIISCFEFLKDNRELHAIFGYTFFIFYILEICLSKVQIKNYGL